jgi:hypothetical protein
MEKTILYSFKGKSGDLLQDLFATMNRAFSSPTPGGLEGKSCLDVIDDAIRADADARGAVVEEARELTHED